MGTVKPLSWQVAKAVLSRVKAAEAQVEAEGDGDADEALGMKKCTCVRVTTASLATGHPQVAVVRSIL